MHGRNGGEYTIRALATQGLLNDSTGCPGCDSGGLSSAGKPTHVCQGETGVNMRCPGGLFYETVQPERPPLICPGETGVMIRFLAIRPDETRIIILLFFITLELRVE